ncbi:hypothetical protein SPOG_00282 [Schizosaccharomyces cryophilus OY26]|uniref:Uncharacterized protein n=1 Tax=Schizosaccharomyces cryophilus (strain OY26 / ATCC MYA-4695 / CBS 11777 / NBRC 106824 / NRRL Y48691) TaxID=653667 RepID=S9W1J3_SCHCR|nr:uncharacterized protein SPOG_00282 [Schizosaccharomyces cryophilus OY26]EPY51860.1 hypothetical protein SPOG_00282 [Schizosaccharomyces cryophilus OY26]
MVSITVNRHKNYLLRTSKSVISCGITTNLACNYVYQRALNVLGFRGGNARFINDYHWYPNNISPYKHFRKNGVSNSSFVNVSENQGRSRETLELSISKLYNDCIGYLNPFYNIYEANEALYLRLIEFFSESQTVFILLQQEFEEEAKIIFEYFQKVACLDPDYSRSSKVTENILNDLFKYCKLLTDKGQEDPNKFIHACVNCLLFLSSDRSFSTVYWQHGSQYQQFLNLLRNASRSVLQPNNDLYKSIEIFFYSILQSYALHKGFIPSANSIDRCLPENMRIKEEEWARILSFKRDPSLFSNPELPKNFSDSSLLSILYSGNYQALSEWLISACKEGQVSNLRILNLLLKGEPKTINLRDTVSLFMYSVKNIPNNSRFLEVKASLLSKLLRVKKLQEFQAVLSTLPNIQSMIEHRRYDVLLPIIDYVTFTKDMDLFLELNTSLLTCTREIPEELYVKVLKCYGQMPKDVTYYKLFKAFLEKNPILDEKQKRYVNSILLKSCHTHLSHVLYREFPHILRPKSPILFFCYCFRKRGNEWILKYLNIAGHPKDDIWNDMITNPDASKTLLKAFCSKYDSSRAIKFLKACSAEGPYPSNLLREILHHAQLENNCETIKWLKSQETEVSPPVLEKQL